MYVEDLRKALALFGNVFVQLFGQTESPMTGTILRAQEHLLDGPLARGSDPAAGPGPAYRSASSTRTTSRSRPARPARSASGADR